MALVKEAVASSSAKGTLVAQKWGFLLQQIQASWKQHQQL
jgi:hypothetical protein